MTDAEKLKKLQASVDEHLEANRGICGDYGLMKALDASRATQDEAWEPGTGFKKIGNVAYNAIRTRLTDGTYGHEFRDKDVAFFEPCRHAPAPQQRETGVDADADRLSGKSDQAVCLTKRAVAGERRAAEQTSAPQPGVGERASAGSPLAREIVRRVCDSSIRLAISRHGLAPSLGEPLEEAPIIDDIVNVLVGDDTGCLEPDELNATNCEALWVDLKLSEARGDGHREGWDLAHEAMKCGHPRTAYRDPEWPKSEGNEVCVMCAQDAELAELRAVLRDLYLLSPLDNDSTVSDWEEWRRIRDKARDVLAAERAKLEGDRGQ